MVLSLFGEEEPPPPPPPPPPTAGERLKAAVNGKVTKVKDNIEYKKKKRATKKAFKGIGEESSSRKGSYKPDPYNVLPQDKGPQTLSQAYLPNDTDYWKTTEGYKTIDNYNNLNKTPAAPPSQSSSSCNNNNPYADMTNTRPKAPNMNTLRSQNHTLRQQNQTLREQAATMDQTIPDRATTIQWDYLASRPGNHQNRTLGRTNTKRDLTIRDIPAPPERTGRDPDYEDKISLQTNKIHCKARTREEQIREREKDFEREDRREQMRSGRGKTLAEDVIAAAARCSYAVVGFYNRIKITVCYTCGLCDPTATNTG